MGVGRKEDDGVGGCGRMRKWCMMKIERRLDVVGVGVLERVEGCVGHSGYERRVLCVEEGDLECGKFKRNGGSGEILHVWKGMRTAT